MLTTHCTARKARGASSLVVALAALALVACGSDRGEEVGGGASPGGPDGSDTGDGDGGGNDSGDDGDGGGDDGNDDGGTGGDDGNTGSEDDGGAGPGCENGWTDPYPPMPTENSPEFPPGGPHHHPGPISTYQGNQWEYSVRIPEGIADTADLPVVFSRWDTEMVELGDYGNYDPPVIRLYLDYPWEYEDDAPNPWYHDADADNFCSPSCTLFYFIDVDGMIEILEDLAKNVRFDHKRVMLLSPFGPRDAFTLGLDPKLQPYLAGVGYWGAEWQQATCPDIAGPADCPSEIYFAIAGCDHSFCPELECLQTVEARGWDADITMETTEDACICPPPGGPPGNDRPHWVGRPAWEPYEAWIMSTSRP